MDSQDVPVIAFFSQLEDPRLDRRKLYKLVGIIGITVCAVICGADC